VIAAKTYRTFLPKASRATYSGQCKKYLLHIITLEALRGRGMANKKAKLAINANPVLVLTNAWLEEHFCPT